MAETRRDYTIQALHHALEVLEAFLETDKPTLGVSEISEKLGLNKSRVFRILNTLERHGFVEQDSETKQYRLGIRLMAFGAAVRRQLNIVQAADPILDELAERSGETVFLGVVDGREAVCIAKRESKHSIRLYAEIGRRAPLHVGGVPKVLLAFMPREERERWLRDGPLPRINERTITDPQQLEKVLERIRQNGYAVEADDLDLGAHSIAAPIRDHTGRVVAAVSVAGPSQRFTPDKIQEFIKLVCRAADEISARLGYLP
ncbi:MAG TPA: IclR family transcriptional regulator [Caldilineae bacterium]|jgi:IclR family KDG regulon transcriptional repressor|nr:IclR family transcriptional regulator [Caldilineae bacterium]